MAELKKWRMSAQKSKESILPASPHPSVSSWRTPASLSVVDVCSFGYKGLPQSSSMTLVPADGAAWTAPTQYLLPEAGAIAEVRFALGGLGC